ncbi:MAG: glycosyltransferase family 39 protein [Phycisphaerales bacterium]|nr:glycosyltransferase family 39 protein [Phycisphaerales bacterium]
MAALPQWAQAAGLLALCAILFVVGLGDRGLAYSEGHRVGPAWEMLDAGMPWEAGDAWLVPRLFETPYLRKPPAMMWAIATSSGLLGKTEFAARLPSAIAMAVLVLVSWRVTTRWLGSPWGLAAGAAQALFPVFWSSARSAEIEMLHAACAGIAALLVADALLRRDRLGWLSALGAGVALAGMALAKGPAGLPVVAAVLPAACIVRWSIGVIARPSLALVLVVPGLVLGLVSWAMAEALGRVHGPVITQDVGEFLWEGSKIGRILTLPGAAWASMLPAGLALFLFLPRRRAERPESGEATGLPPRAERVGRVLALAWLIATLTYAAIGVSNPRYTLPAGTLLPPVVAAALALWRTRAEEGGLRGPRRGAARVLWLAWPGSWIIVLAVGFVGFLVWYEAPRGRTSGDEAGAGLAAVLERETTRSPSGAGADPRGPIVWADQLVECRPEVLLYARRWNPLVRARWNKPLESVEPAVGDILIVRTDRHALGDAEPTERERCTPMLGHAERVHAFDVHKYSFEVYAVRSSPAVDDPPAARTPEPTADPTGP